VVEAAAVATYVGRQIPLAGAAAAGASCGAAGASCGAAGASCGGHRIPCLEAGAECQSIKQKRPGKGRNVQFTIGGMPIIMGGIIGGGGI